MLLLLVCMYRRLSLRQKQELLGRHEHSVSDTSEAVLCVQTLKEMRTRHCGW